MESGVSVVCTFLTLGTCTTAAALDGPGASQKGTGMEASDEII
jgi:hypothetical protein